MSLNKRIFILTLIFSWAAGAYAQDFVYDARGKRNPFIPLVSSEGRLLKLDKEEGSSQKGLNVEGIIYDKLGRSFAIVNAQVVSIGDMVGDYQILKILDNKVIFIKDGEPLEIELNQEEAK